MRTKDALSKPFFLFFFLFALSLCFSLFLTLILSSRLLVLAFSIVRVPMYQIRYHSTKSEKERAFALLHIVVRVLPETTKMSQENLRRT